MGILFCGFMIWLLCKGCKALFRVKPKTRRKDPPVFQDSTVYKNLAELARLQEARDTQEEIISYIQRLFYDDTARSDKEILYWMKQEAQAKKQLAAIEKQIQRITAG